MGYGDEILATGMARGAAARGKRIAFGDGSRINWSPQAHEIFQNNPNVARPGSEQHPNLEWIRHYRGHRLYARQHGGHWVWDYSFKPIPGEIFLTAQEQTWAKQMSRGRKFVLIEPAVKSSAPNKQWPRQRYAHVAQELLQQGYKVAQFSKSGPPLVPNIWVLPQGTFRQALATLTYASLYIGPEGGLHHGAAALGVPAVVIFGGFISPRSTGYEGHVNLFTGGVACGTIGRPCRHCRAAMEAIAPGTVINEAHNLLKAHEAARLV